MLLMHASPLLPFNALEDKCFPPPRLPWFMPPTSLSLWFWDSSDYLLQIPFPFDPILNSHALFRSCFIYFDFRIILTMRRNYSLVSHVLFIPQHCSPILSCFTYQKSMNFSHHSVKKCVSRWSHKCTSINRSTDVIYNLQQIYLIKIILKDLKTSVSDVLTVIHWSNKSIYNFLSTLVVSHWMQNVVLNC